MTPARKEGCTRTTKPHNAQRVAAYDPNERSEMTESTFERDPNFPRLIVPTRDSVRSAPGLYTTVALTAPEPGLYAFEDADRDNNGGIND
ncbi:hypothetical protein GCM10007269_27580 [Microbacterium murale]|uniref:Uncharacterized protein n=1 Tax=Microbacterium murale TaxID=1081040 RepID=A0ABQ1RYD6_9MICO|nr:hypothetical protein GCM10007269_27580 [Microbacterium murale]